MSSVERRNVAVKIGGSVLLIENEYNVSLIRDFAQLFSDINQAAIVTGGGEDARRNIRAFEALGETNKNILHRVAMGSTREHAFQLAMMLNSLHIPTVHVHDIRKKIPRKYKGGTSGGHKEGVSTDTVLLRWALALGFEKVIKITNVPCIYEHLPDGSLNTNMPIESITWENLDKMLGRDFGPGMHKILDPTAVQIGSVHNMILHVVGTDMKNVEEILNGNNMGTTIHP